MTSAMPSAASPTLRRIGALVKQLAQQAKGVRGRSALLSSVAVLVVLSVGALIMLGLFRSQLIRTLDDTLVQSAQSRADLVDQGADPATLIDPGRDASFVWIGGQDGALLAAAGPYLPLEMTPPTVFGRAIEQELLVAEIAASGEEEERERQNMRLAAAETNSGLVVVTGAETETLDETLGQLGRIFSIAVPIMVLVVLFLSWLTVGRALRPVDQIRHEAAVIGGQDLSRRVPVPGANDEIQHLAVTMNDMLERLEAHDESLRQFTADASHELKSPVANLRVLLETQTIEDPAWSGLQSKLQGELERLRALIDNLLFLAGHDEQPSSVSATAKANVALDDLLFAEAELVAATTDLEVNISGVGPALVRGSASDLQRMFRNLSDNAARHASEQITYRCRQDDNGSTVVEILDDGTGIPPEDRQRVFERFTRLDHGRGRDAGGTGLGLAIVSAVARDHGAEVDVDYSDRARSSGARFVVTFPA